jgi:hypothetical protein
MLMHSHVLSHVAHIKYNDICTKIAQIQRETEELGLNVNGWIMSTLRTEGSEHDNELMEIEFLAPVDRKFESTENFKYKSQFKLINAVKMRYEGDIFGIRKSELALNNYLSEHHLEPITHRYFSYIQAPEDSPDSVIIDVYVGINMNVL